MPSRRPPSQRDPAYALHRLLGRIEQAVPGLRVKNATPVRQTAPVRNTGGGPPSAEVVGADVGSTTTGTMTMPAGGGSYGLVFDDPYAYSMTDLPGWAGPGSAGNVGVTGLGMFAVHVTCSYTNTTGENATLTAVCAANDDFNIDIILPPTTAATPVTGFAIWPLVGFAGPGGDLAAVCIVAGSGGDVTLQSGGVFVSRLG